MCYQSCYMSWYMSDTYIYACWEACASNAPVLHIAHKTKPVHVHAVRGTHKGLPVPMIVKGSPAFCAR